MSLKNGTVLRLFYSTADELFSAGTERHRNINCRTLGISASALVRSFGPRFASALPAPSRTLRERIHAERHPTVVVIDEIQKIPQLLDVVHALIEEKRMAAGNSLCPFGVPLWNRSDFIVYGPDGFWAIEVKNSTRVRDEELRGLNTFLDDYPEAQALYLYRGTEKLKRGRVLCLPCEEFLKTLKPGKPL